MSHCPYEPLFPTLGRTKTHGRSHDERGVPASVAVHGVVDAADDLPADAPTVVLSNSLGTTHPMWDKQVAELSRNFRVVRYDIRGHGRTPAPDGRALRGDIPRRHDWAAVRHPGAAPRRPAGGALHVRASRARVRRRQRAATVREQGSRAVADAVVERWFSEPWRTANPVLAAAAADMVADTPAEGYASCCEAIAAMNQLDQLPGLAAPTLAIAGADHPATPPAHIALIADQVQDGRLLVVENAAHLANDEQPSTVSAAVLGHLLASP